MNKFILVALLFSLSLFAESARQKLKNEGDKAILLEAFKVNENLHMAFYKYDAAKVSKFSQSLKSILEKIKGKEVVKILGRASKQLAKISKEKSQDQNNKLYSLVSKSLISLLAKYDLGKDYNAYSCPMVKMAWVQNSTKINKVHNPYASYMPHCGTKDTNY